MKTMNIINPIRDSLNRCGLALFVGAGLAATAHAAPPVIAGGNGSFETSTYTNPGTYGLTGTWETSAGTAAGWTFTGLGRWFMQGDNGGGNYGAVVAREF